MKVSAAQRDAPLHRKRGTRVFTIILTIAALFLLAAVCIAPAAADSIPIDGGALSSGTYILTDDVTLTADNVVIPEGAEVTIDLAGHILETTLAGSVITVETGGSLTLIDSNPAAAHAGTQYLEDGLWKIGDAVPTGAAELGAAEYLTGGIITGGMGSDGGGVYVSKDGTFTMNDGNIIGNTAEYGGGVYVREDGTFTMNGGNIIGNTAEEGGGGVIVDGEFIMNGGNIVGNTAEYGGGVELYGKFEMTGGTITKNTAYDGGGVDVDVESYGGAFIISGNPKISGNTLSDKTTPNNVYLYDGKITIGGDLADAEIGFTPGYSYFGAVIATNAKSGDDAKFKSDIDGFTSKVIGDTLILKSDKPDPTAGDHPGIHEGVGTVEWKEWNMTTAEPTDSGYYYLGSDVVLNRTWSVPSGTTVLCLNGYSLSMNDGVGDRVIDVPSGATLTLYDCSADQTGTITGGQDSGVYVDGTFIVNGGNITGNTAGRYSSGGGVYVSDEGTFTMNGGKIIGNTAEYGGGVYVYGGEFSMNTGSTIAGNEAAGGGGVFVDDGEFTMYGGTIGGEEGEANTATMGSGVCVYSGEFIMYSGTISDNIAEEDGGGVYVRGGEFTMDGGIITGNTAGRYGGGILIYDGWFTMNSGDIAGNEAESGSGVLNFDGTFTMSDGDIHADNDVYLNGDKDEDIGELLIKTNIIVSGDSFAGSVKNITLDKALLFEGSEVVVFTGTVVDNWAEKFVLKNTYANLNLVPSEDMRKLILSFPSLPITEPTIDEKGNTTISGRGESTQFDDETNTLEIKDEDSGVNVTVQFEAGATKTGDAVNGKVESVTISYNPASSTAETTGTATVYQLTIIMENVSKAYPAINGNYDDGVAEAVTDENSNHKPLVMITALMGSGDFDAFNNNITEGGIVLTFTIPKSLILDSAKIKAYHVDESGATPVAYAVVSDGNNWKITVYGDSFSSYVIAKDTTTTDDTPAPQTSSPQGSSVWLTETPTPTPTETAEPTLTETAPTEIPTGQPTEQPKSPGFGILAVVAGLGVVAVLRRR